MPNFQERLVRSCEIVTLTITENTTMNDNQTVTKEAPLPQVRRHRLDLGLCPYCDRCWEERLDFHPSHDASRSCESGKHNHCSCDTCF